MGIKDWLKRGRGRPGQRLHEVPVAKPLPKPPLSGISLRRIAQMPPGVFATSVRNHLKHAFESGRFWASDREEFLRDHTSAWLSNSHLRFLCAELGVRNSAFLFRQNHVTFITKADNSHVRVYDPLLGRIVIHGTNSLASELREEKSTTTVVLSSDLERDWASREAPMQPVHRGDARFRILGISQPYSALQHLIDIMYRKPEGAARKLGRIQGDAHNCAPLSLYAAVHAMSEE